MTRLVLPFLAVLPLISPAAAVPDDEDTVTVGADGLVYELEELIRFVAKETGEKIAYDPEAVESRKVELAGPQTVPRKHLFEWFRSVLSFQRLLLVPVVDVDGSIWLLLSMGQIPPRLRSPHWPARSLEIERYERLLAESRTETAAGYFLRRIENLRGN